jgi:hypothetical protein
MQHLLRFAVLLSILLALGTAHARDKDEIPPATAKPLSEIVESLEAEGHTVITDIDFDDWVWVVRTYKAGLEFELRVDPVTGEVLSIRPD